MNIEFELTNEQKIALEKYASLLLEWNEKFNLTAITKIDEIAEKHFVDSLIPTKYVDLKEGTLIDVGTGAGFPGVPLAIFNPNLKVTLLESNGKKITFLNEVKKELKLDNVTIVNSRAEEAKNLFGLYDFVTARAVKELNILLEICSVFLKNNGFLLAYKGSDAMNEASKCKRAFKVLNCELFKSYSYNLPTSKDTRNLLVIKKIKQAPKKYPRNYSEIVKSPL